jgi:hypothetical protein
VKVKLKQEGQVIGWIEVLEHGALAFKLGGKEVELSAGDSRRIAGAVLQESVTGGIKEVRRGVRRRAHEELDALLGDDDEDDEDEDEDEDDEDT